MRTSTSAARVAVACLALLPGLSSLQTPSPPPPPLHDGASSRRGWLASVAAGAWGVALAGSPSTASAGIDVSGLKKASPAAIPQPIGGASDVASLTGGFIYQKQEVLQGKVFAQERAEKVRVLEQTFAKARKSASDMEAGLALGGDSNPQLVTQVRRAFRAPPFKDFRKSGREILTLIEAQDAAFPERPSELKRACAAFDQLLAAVEAADGASMRVEQGSGSVAEVGYKLRALDAPLGVWVRVVDGWVEDVAAMQAKQ